MKFNLMLKQFLLLLFCFTAISFSGEAKRSCKPRILPLTTIHIVDRNGFAETLSGKDRINQFQNVDFLKPQPYQKVLLIYARDSKGDIRSVITTYHLNGNPKQFLEVLNGRANGLYVEWHENGTTNITANVIGGVADLTTVAEKSWLFDGPNMVWDDCGTLLAQINYCQGSLEGVANYYHANGNLWKKIPYEKDHVHGVKEIYTKNGQLLMQTNFRQGFKEGKSIRFWDCDNVASEEFYCAGELITGQYFDEQGVLISEVKQGTGYKVIFSQKAIREIQEIQNGYVEGEVKIFDCNESLKRVYHLKENIKHGEEIEYYPKLTEKGLQPKLSFNWYEGKVQGLAKTWYQNGNLESQKEMSNNKKNGVSTAWYKDGNLMMMEEYDEGKLIRGEYFKKRERIPISQVICGKGVATIYDAEGNFVQKINYHNSKPEVKR